MKLLDNNSKVIKVYKELSRAQGVSALLPLAIVVIFFTVMSDNFLNSYNVMNILRQASVYAIMATGMTFVILTGGIDLGQGSVLALAAVVCAKVINATGNMWLGILSAVAVGVVIGGINGVMIAYVRLPAFIMTLGSLYMVRGITLYITNSTQVNVKGAELFSFIGQGFLLGIPFPVYLFIGIGILAVIFLCYTSTGRHIFAVGSNVVSARLSGVKVEKTLVVAYILSSVCVALAGVVYLARLTAAQPTAGEGYELESIAAAVVGGTSLAGGEGGVLGTLIGAVIIAVIRNGLVIIGVGSYFTKIVVGLIIVLAVTLDVMRRRFSSNR
ncbi:ABC transporter permease [uncultured Sphaerochaeta sp.]|uniref:ABC transporter permease n=1 Tax=uncultured Sphaerochaeta sp. TaxID=886478 RepID=UPI002AA8FB8B|nr:ABC transporter permease [uncultured Sphaerochaeta sp.]